jgi:hypothetical protein
MQAHTTLAAEEDTDPSSPAPSTTLDGGWEIGIVML